VKIYQILKLKMHYKNYIDIFLDQNWILMPKY